LTSETHTDGGAVIRKPGSAWLEGTPAIDRRINGKRTVIRTVILGETHFSPDFLGLSPSGFAWLRLDPNEKVGLSRLIPNLKKILFGEFWGNFGAFAKTRVELVEPEIRKKKMSEFDKFNKSG